MTPETVIRIDAEEARERRELDAQVAEHVMGWVWWVSGDTGQRAIFADDYRPFWFTQRASGDEPLCRDHDASVPHYSTDIKEAWAVVEKMQANGWAFEYQNIHMHDAVFSLRRGNRARVHADDCETAPLAICHAALAAARCHSSGVASTAVASAEPIHEGD